eukprot:365535-Chlamydomonas_euryale.AAC.97
MHGGIFCRPSSKQERAFTAWLNSHLSGVQPTFRRETDKALMSKCDSPSPGRTRSPATAMVSESPQANGEGQLLLQQMSSRVRGAMWCQYRNNKALFDMLSKVFGKVDAGYFTMADNPLTADRVTASKLAEPLMSYHPFWMRLGLAVIFRDVNRESKGGLDNPPCRVHSFHSKSVCPRTRMLPGMPEVGVQSSVLSEEKIWRRSAHSLIREVLLSEKDMQAAYDKAALWVRHQPRKLWPCSASQLACQMASCTGIISDSGHDSDYA